RTSQRFQGGERHRKIRLPQVTQRGLRRHRRRVGGPCHRYPPPPARLAGLVQKAYRCALTSGADAARSADFVESRQLSTEVIGKSENGRRVSVPNGTNACLCPRPGPMPVRPRRRQFQCADVVQRAFIARQGGRARPSGRSSPDRCASFTSLWPGRPSGAYSLDAMSMRIGATMRPTVVFDFDGTVALGRGPLEAYATCLGELTDGEMLTACRTAVERFDAGET